MKKTLVLFLSIVSAILVICIIFAFYFYLNEFKYTVSSDLSSCFSNLSFPVNEDKYDVKNYIYKQNYSYKNGLFYMEFLDISVGYDTAKHYDFLKTTLEGDVAISDINCWIKYPRSQYHTIIEYRNGAFYLEAFVYCNNPKNEEKVFKGIESFVEHVNSCFS